MYLTEILNTRTEFEKITEGYNMTKGSDINNIEWFIENGHRSNRLRDGFDDALKCAHKIKEYADGGRGNEGLPPC